MFDNPPKILSHISVLENGNFVLPDYILSRGADSVNLFHRYCPHRMYPLHNVGDTVSNIKCNFHGFEWSKDGTPLNNDRKLNCGTAQIGKSGLIFKNFKEPDHKWVDDLASETNLKFSHTKQGKSTGSWLWMMEIQADLLHILPGDNVVHPWLASVENLEQVEMDEGDGWILQTCSTGWWLFIYPFVFVEWSNGCVSVNYTIPDDINNEFGFSWVTQFFYNSATTQERQNIFEKLEDVLHEDVAAIESQKGLYFPLMKSQNKLENHCVHFGKWVTAHKKR